MLLLVKHGHGELLRPLLVIRNIYAIFVLLKMFAKREHKQVKNVIALRGIA